MIINLFTNKSTTAHKLLPLLCLSSIQRKSIIQSINDARGFAQYNYDDVPNMVKLNLGHVIRINYWLSNLHNYFCKKIGHNTITHIY